MIDAHHSTVDSLLRANETFARTDQKAGVPEIPFVPNKQVYLITCIDPRVDPANLFGLTLGDAIVHRVVGGRVTEAVLDDLAWISYLHETLTPDTPWFDVVVMHHTDCGSGLMADDTLRRGFVARGFRDDVLRATAVTDPAATVALDVDRLLSSEKISGRIRVTGLRYDVDTGRAARVTGTRSREG
ncbi:carbonic anhydrase [Frondihabitans sucicola]|uniref:carbonic anhydrase n=1 Tax=Frondihabitans sucicola TaxID=1268041 RepID=A0ABM8GLU8_9MICO|nr:carbonic anhydrase [Frondihabitans sucicola]BDZ49346.1 carbonic anhydrase [Frondihabitans sucicola]